MHDGVSCAAVPVRSPAGALVAGVLVTVRGADSAAAAAHAGMVEQFAGPLGRLLG